MKYVNLILLMFIVANVQAEIVDGAVVIPEHSTGQAPTGVINRDRRTDASSTLLLGIVKDDSVEIVESAEQPVEEEIKVDFGLGDGLIVSDPAYSIPPTVNPENNNIQ